MSPEEGSVTHWVSRLQAGDPAAAEQLWRRYFPRLVGLARKRLQSAPRRAADEEDVALSAFVSFCRSAEQGRFPQLSDRDSLWRVLVVITGRKAYHLVRDESREKRGGPAGERAEEQDLCQILSREPGPEFAAQFADDCERLLRALGDRELAAVALSRMEGYTIEEIAGRLGYSVRSIKRKLQLIRRLWEKEEPV
jgi:RNA polymerase sigma factor (sigma-70 family)